VIITEASEPAICCASFMTLAIASSPVYQVTGIVGDGGQNGGDQFRVGRQRDVFLGAGVDRGDRRPGVVGDAAGDDRYMNMLGFEPHHQIADIEGDVDQQEVGALAAAQHPHRLFMVLRMGHGSAIVHRDLGAVVSWPLSVPTMRSRMIISCSSVRAVRAPYR